MQRTSLAKKPYKSKELEQNYCHMTTKGSSTYVSANRVVPVPANECEQ
jgi:hypothetical protein